MAKKMQSVSDDPQRDHYGEICDLSHEVAQSQSAWFVAREDTHERKKLFDKLSGDLLGMIEGGPDWQKKLEFGDE